MGRRGAETHLPLCDYIFFYVDRRLLTLTGLGSIRLTRRISGGSDSFSALAWLESCNPGSSFLMPVSPHIPGLQKTF
jgi:hypothetical protein